MGRLVVESIAAQDFLSYRERQEITLNGQGPVAVVGPNGAGKSTLVSKALSWGLYGTCSPERMGSGTRSLKGKGVVRKRLEGAQLDQVEAKEAVVEITLRDGSTCHTVKRTRTKGRKSKVEIRTVDDEHGYDEIDGIDQQAVDNLIGADHSVFTRTVLRGQNDPWNFAEATDAKKREILDAISGADRLAVTYERAVELRKQRTTQAGTYRSQAEDAERRASAQNVEQVQGQADSWATGQAMKAQSVRQEIAHAEARLVTARQEDTQAQANSQARANLEAQRPTVDLAPYDRAIEEAAARYMQAKGEYDQLEAEWNRISHLEVGHDCPTCQQKIAQGSAIDVAKNDLRAKQPDKITAVQQLHKHWRECQDSKTKAQAWLQDELGKWQAQLNAVPQYTGSKTPVVEAELNQLRRRLTDIESAQNPFTAALVQVGAAKLSLQREAAVYREEEIRAESERRLAAAWEEVLHPKGVRAHLAEATLAAIETEANRWLTILSGGRMTVRFPPTKETKGRTREEIQTIVTIGGTEIDFLNFSGGERRRVNLAVDLGVAAVFSEGKGLSVSLLVLDEEVVSGLDADGKAAVLTALHDAGVADVVIIDHDPTLTGALPRTIRVSRGEDDYSKVEEVT
jgi:DNA repair exonuclease SbcCD ATPase subunit